MDGSPKKPPSLNPQIDPPEPSRPPPQGPSAPPPKPPRRSNKPSLEASEAKTSNASNTLVQSCPIPNIHAKLQIEEVSFIGGHPINIDTISPFLAPYWQRNRPAEWPKSSDPNRPVIATISSWPVCYTRNSLVKLSRVKFNVTTAPTVTEEVHIAGRATFGNQELNWIVVVSVKPSDTEIILPTLTSSDQLPDMVGKYGTKIAWQYNPADVGWSQAGTSDHVFYVTLGDPDPTLKVYWTMLDLSCEGAHSETTEDGFVRKSFEPFTQTLGDGNGFRRKRDGQELSYYKYGADTPGIYSPYEILNRQDGTGRCGAWARFLVYMHRLHGVTSSEDFGVVPINSGNNRPGFPYWTCHVGNNAYLNATLIVKNCTFQGAGTIDQNHRNWGYTHKGKAECIKNDGILGQGKDNPQFWFGDHALVRHRTGIYDPSYGVSVAMKPNGWPSPLLETLKAWEDKGIAGLGGQQVTNFQYKGDRQMMPNGCSKGFVWHEVQNGETLATVAAYYQISRVDRLYYHDYNFALRQSRPNQILQAGDVVVIPRALSKRTLLWMLS